MHEALFLHKAKMLPHRIRTLEAEVRRRLLERGRKARLLLTILDESQDLLLSSR